MVCHVPPCVRSQRVSKTPAQARSRTGHEPSVGACLLCQVSLHFFRDHSTAAGYGSPCDCASPKCSHFGLLSFQGFAKSCEVLALPTPNVQRLISTCRQRPNVIARTPHSFSRPEASRTCSSTLFPLRSMRVNSPPLHSTTRADLHPIIKLKGPGHRPTARGRAVARPPLSDSPQKASRVVLKLQAGVNPARDATRSGLQATLGEMSVAYSPKAGQATLTRLTCSGSYRSSCSAASYVP